MPLGQIGPLQPFNTQSSARCSGGGVVRYVTLNLHSLHAVLWHTELDPRLLWLMPDLVGVEMSWVGALCLLPGTRIARGSTAALSDAAGSSPPDAQLEEVENEGFACGAEGIAATAHLA